MKRQVKNIILATAFAMPAALIIAGCGDNSAVTPSPDNTVILPYDKEVINIADMENDNNILDSIPMVFVKGGTFDMGCTAEQGSDCDSFESRYERPAKNGVTVGDFYIGKYEMTQDIWVHVMGAENNRGSIKGSNYPADSVTWNEIQIFIEKLNKATGKSYRLPTEAEWEYAARGGSMSEGFKYSGSDNANEVAWHSSNNGGKAQPVGTKKPNELGLYDMSGNVWEWVNDYYAEHNVYTETDNPQGPAVGDSQGRRVLRSGSWPYGAFYCRVSYRRRQPQDYRGTISFRLAHTANTLSVLTDSNMRN